MLNNYLPFKYSYVVEGKAFYQCLGILQQREEIDVIMTDFAVKGDLGSRESCWSGQ